MLSMEHLVYFFVPDVIIHFCLAFEKYRYHCTSNTMVNRERS